MTAFEWAFRALLFIWASLFLAWCVIGPLWHAFVRKPMATQIRRRT